MTPINLGSTFNELAWELVDDARLGVLVTTQGLLPLRTSKTRLAQLERLGMDTDAVALVVNRYERNSSPTVMEIDRMNRPPPSPRPIMRGRNGDEESCDGLYIAEVQPGSHDCADFDPARIEFELRTTISGATAPAATCTSGSGTFSLLPRTMLDRDEDGDYQAVFDVVQTSGTGTMRRADWVTNIELVEDKGKNLRVLHSGQAAVFNGSDQLQNASTVTTAITGTPSFLASEISHADRWEMQVELDWSCETSPSTVSGLSTGYVIPTETIGCDTVQDLVLRVYNNPNRVHIEQYGYPQHKVVIPTTNTASGRRFVYDWNYFHLDATLESWNSGSAQIRIDELKWDASDVCDADTYTFQAE